jgi:quercetin dioxygenase-like cupin family protein
MMMLHWEEATMVKRFRRVVTGHDSSGKAIFLSDGDAQKVQPAPRAGVVSTLFWVTDETPATLVDDRDAADRTIGITPPMNGSIFRVVEYAPDTTVKHLDARERDWKAENGGRKIAGEGIQMNPDARHHGMHRTESIDYAIILSGEIYIMLDDSEKLLRAGDVLVQQGTWHAWSNRGTEPCHIAFILIGAKTPWK